VLIPHPLATLDLVYHSTDIRQDDLQKYDSNGLQMHKCLRLKQLSVMPHIGKYWGETYIEGLNSI
jgi:hypothetical protein